MTHRYANSSDNTRIFYRVKRKGERFLVFLHGWMHNHTAWKKELEYFEQKGYSTIAVDLRGHGCSEKPDKLKDYSFKKFAEDIEAIVEKEKLDEFVLIGHSFGGMIAMEYYNLFPERIKALVLLDTIYENPLKHLPVIKHLKITPFISHILKFILKNNRIRRKHFSHVNFSKFKNHSDFFYWMKGTEEIPVKSILSCLEEMLLFDKKNLLSKINIPTLIIEGEKDTKTSVKAVKKMAGNIKNSKLAIIKGASHDTNIKVFKAVEKEIQTFLKKINYKN